MPLRVKMVLDAIFWTLPTVANSLVRSTPAAWNGKKVTCVLVSAGGSTQPTPGRRWVESEWCIDPQSELLQIFSPATGLYAVYDYEGGPKFHGHTLAKEIVVYQNGSDVLHIHLDRIRNANPNDSSLLALTDPMKANGPRAINEEPFRVRLFAAAPGGASNRMIQPVFVHAMLGANETVVEAETLQAPDAALVQAAIERAKAVLPNSLPPGASSYQREAYLDLEFNPAGAQAFAAAPTPPNPPRPPVPPAPGIPAARGAPSVPRRQQPLRLLLPSGPPSRAN